MERQQPRKKEWNLKKKRKKEKKKNVRQTCKLKLMFFLYDFEKIVSILIYIITHTKRTIHCESIAKINKGDEIRKSGQNLS